MLEKLDGREEPRGEYVWLALKLDGQEAEGARGRRGEGAGRLVVGNVGSCGRSGGGRYGWYGGILVRGCKLCC